MNDINEFNHVVGGLQFSLAEQLRDPFLLFDHKGRLLKTWETEVPARDVVLNKILAAKTIFDLFKAEVADFNKMDFSRGLVKLWATQDVFGYDTFEREFYTRVPVFQLAINPGKEGLFFGTLMTKNAFLAARGAISSGLIWVDEKDGTIAGLDHQVFRAVNDRFKHPYELIGLPVTSLFSPSPMNLDTPQSVSESDSLQPFKLQFTHLDWLSSRQTRTSDLSELQTDSDKTVVWENESEASADFLRIASPFRRISDDFELRIVLENVSGTLPLILFGERTHPEIYPDAVGYAVGQQYERTTVFLKRDGTVVREVPFVFSQQEKIGILIVKVGLDFHVYINERPILHWHDLESQENDALVPWLSLRPKCKVKIHSFSFGIRKSATSSPEAFPVIRLLGKEERFYTFKCQARYKNSVKKEFFQSYLLSDITLIEKEKQRLKRMVEGAGVGDDGFISVSRSLTDIRENATTAAKSGATILIQGETGTGKEVLAKFIHRQSPFSDGPFIKVDCSTLSPNIIESELFGHEKGAFTGAGDKRVGRFEEGNQGVLFLDEVGNLSLEVQIKLLAFLQDFSITRVGGTKPIPLKVQVVAATNIPLSTLVEKGLFRRDLMFRLDVFNFTLPPLKERQDDLPQLCDYFIRLFAERHGKSVRRLSGNGYRKLFEYSWPGNIRELRNIIQRAVVYCDGEEIEERHLSLPETQPSFLVKKESSVQTTPAGKRILTNEIDAEAFSRLAHETKGNVNKMAKQLSVARLSIYNLAKRYQLHLPDFR